MRTRTTSLLSLFAAFGLLLGCSADIADGSAALHEVDVQALTSQTLYLVPDSLVPLTAEEAAGYDEALPVRVELLEDTAVAWYAPAGEAIISRETILALWTIEQRTEISDAVAAGEEPAVASATEEPDSAAPYLELPGSADPIESELILVNPQSAAETAILDFFDRLGSPEEIPMLREIGGAHPGCI